MPRPDAAWVARYGHPAERAVLAGDEGLAPEVVATLVEDNDERVLQWLAWNDSVGPEVLQRIADRRPELAAHAARNRNAPPNLKDMIPIGDHSLYSVQHYLSQRNASAVQRAFVLSEHRRSFPAGGRLLADVWMDASAQL